MYKTRFGRIESGDLLIVWCISLYQSNKILDQSNLKDFADDKINVTYVTNLGPGRVENIVGKRRKCW